MQNMCISRCVYFDCRGSILVKYYRKLHFKAFKIKNILMHVFLYCCQSTSLKEKDNVLLWCVWILNICFLFVSSSIFGYERETSVHFLSPFVLHWIFLLLKGQEEGGGGACYKRMRQTRLGAIKVKNQLRTSSSKAITVSTLREEHHLNSAFIYKWCGIEFLLIIYFIKQIVQDNNGPPVNITWHLLNM